MNITTQEEFDSEIEKLVAHINELAKEHGSVQKAIVMGNKDILGILATYELDIIPGATESGFKAKSLTELLGFEIKITPKEKVKQCTEQA